MAIVVEPFLGVWPVMLAPVRISMPRFLNDRPTTLATSVSQPARIEGSASSTEGRYAPPGGTLEAKAGR